MSAAIRGRAAALVLASALSLSAPRAAAAQSCPARERWPTPDWEVATSSRTAEIAAVESYAFTLTGADEERLGIRTDAVVIVWRGRVIYEKYARGWDAQKRHLAWSVSKSVTNVLAGRAVVEGAVAVGDSVCKHLSGRSGESCDITLDALLQHASGLDWKEVYEGQSNQESSVLAMLYGEGKQDMAGFVLDHPRRAVPGTRFSYSTGDSTLLAAALHAAMKPRHGDDWPWKVLFEPLGITSAVFERDATGAPVGGSYWYATPRDYARIGYLFLADGCWAGQRLLPEGWVRASTSVSEAYAATPPAEIPAGDVQGRQWWLNRAEKGRERMWTGVPDDAYAALGHWGQSITVIPSRDLVVVRTGDDRDEDALDLGVLLERAMEVAR